MAEFGSLSTSREPSETNDLKDSRPSNHQLIPSRQRANLEPATRDLALDDVDWQIRLPATQQDCKPLGLDAGWCIYEDQRHIFSPSAISQNNMQYLSRQFLEYLLISLWMFF